MTNIIFSHYYEVIRSSFTINITINRNARCQKYNPPKNQNNHNNKQLNHTKEITSQHGAKESWAAA